MTAGRRPVRRALGIIAVVLLAGGSLAGTAHAQGNDGKLSFSTGADFSHAYFFRGILQEHQGIIAQPYFDLSVNLFEGTQGLNSVSFNIGQWNSLHSGPTGTDGPAANVDAWYESDFYAGVGLGVDNWDFGLTYTSYLSPNDAFGTVKELALSLTADDSAWLGSLALSPHVLIAIELDGQADGGRSEGVYFELGVEPSFDVDTVVPISLSVPITVGLSMSDYYEASPGDDRAFGFISLGVVGSRPIPVGEAYGNWDLTAGIHLFSLGDGLASVNNGDELQAVATVGVCISY